MAVSILKDISAELYVVVIKLKFYEGNDLTSYILEIKILRRRWSDDIYFWNIFPCDAGRWKGL